MIYIHIPFCKSRCIYCDFFSSTLSASKEPFVYALQKEIECRADEIRAARANTVYIGGGTPSQLSPAQLNLIFDKLSEVVPLEIDAEVTLECNPDDVTTDFVSGLLTTPVNRISMGAQSMNDDFLRLLNRRHTSRQTIDAVALLRSFGYNNISLDLMYGLPGQTLSMWQRDVDEIVALNVPHLSAYSLQWEEGTLLYDMLERGEVEEADEETILAMYRHLIQVAKNYGYEHYEISNFAKPGKRACHNSGYWRDEPYVGLGPGAHSYDGAYRRSSNRPDLLEYINNVGAIQQDVEILSEDERYEEQVLKGLRTIDGFDLNTVADKYRNYALEMAAPHIESGRMQKSGCKLSLTEEGFFVSNDIMSDMML